ncbi:MAG TPA: hypothetical protein VFJ84_00085 [Candidatus Saccharimonadales bacterium]|nr:hypothetical protein [Candidatus Saccharimonadales bacterium]
MGEGEHQVTPPVPEAAPPQPEPAPEAAVDAPPAEQQPDYNQILAAVETATDASSLMSAVTALERVRQYDKVGVYSKAYEAAVRLGDRDLALMYGGRVNAELMSKSAMDIHAAVGGMNESSSRMNVAAQSIAASADLINRSSHNILRG